MTIALCRNGILIYNHSNLLFIMISFNYGVNARQRL